MTIALLLRAQGYVVCVTNFQEEIEHSCFSLHYLYNNESTFSKVTEKKETTGSKEGNRVRRLYVAGNYGN